MTCTRSLALLRRLPSTEAALWLLAVAAWLALVAVLIPHRVVAFGDDFGYIESVVFACRNGPLHPSDWLEPFNLPLAWVCAGLYRITHNFFLSTWGVVGLLSLGNVVLLRAWLRPVFASGRGAVLATLAVAMNPVWLYKSFEFTGVPLGLTCTLVALLAWRQKNWSMFLVAFVIGFLNRQSAVCLLAFPAVTVIEAWMERRPFPWTPLVTLLAGVILVGAAVMAIPPNYARLLNAGGWRRAMHPEVLGSNLAVALVGMAALRAFWDFLTGQSLSERLRTNFARPVGPLAIMMAGAWLLTVASTGLAFETPGGGGAGPLLILMATLAGAWLSDWTRRPPPAVLFFVVGYALLVTSRGKWWDYYFLEPALVLVCTPIRVMGRPAVWRAGLFVAVGLLYAFLLVGRNQAQEQRLVTYELAVRAGTIRVSEASEAPFGWLAWNLFDCARNRKVSGAGFVDFLKYVEGGRSGVTTNGLVIDRNGERLSVHPSGEPWVLPTDYRPRVFPLNNAEWAELLDGPSP